MYCAWRIPAHLRCTQCSILLHLMDICFLTCICLWQISQIQTFLFRVVGPGLVLDITRFCEQQRQPSSGSAWSACPKNGKSGPHCWGQGGSTQFAQQLEFAVTAPPLVGCVVWSQWTALIMIDLSAAFDTISHSILLQRLRNRYGITHKALKWFQSYLAERYQCVSISVQINHRGPTRQCIGSSAVFIICRTYWIYY